jgi:hypothetical protein
VQVRWLAIFALKHPTSDSRSSTPTVECKSDLEYVLLLELDGKERGLQKQRGQQDELNEEKSAGSGWKSG